MMVTQRMTSSSSSCSVLLCLLSLVPVLLSRLTPHQSPIDFLPKTSWSLVGHTTSLPCEIEPEDPGEQLYTVLWYKDDDGEPIYTFDARSGSGSGAHSSASHWSEEQPRGFGSRARLVISPHPAQLVIDKVRPGDAGIYRCRVDFKSSQTRNSMITLAIIAPPSEVTIRHRSTEVTGSRVGPVTAGDTVTLSCLATGAPGPTIAWYRDGVLVDATSETQDSVVVNTMNIHNVGHKETQSSFTCRAHNNNITKPVSRTITININFPPSDVKIVGLSSNLIAGKSQKLHCVSAGSRPGASLTWWLDDQLLGQPSEVYSQETGVTSSSLEIILSPEDNMKRLSCRAENKFISGSSIKSTLELNIKFKPRVRLQWGANIDGDNIVEKQDVYLECLTSANPPVSRIQWLHDGYRVEPSKRPGADTVVISGHSLVIQGVTPAHSGVYSCVTSNTEGDAVSRVLELRVKFRPRCEEPGPRSVFLPLNIQAEVMCRVTAHPAPTHWWWTFNNTHQLDQVPSEKFHNNRSLSVLRYTPTTTQDYGVLSCWARNSQGQVEEACTYELVQSSESLHSLECQLHNQTGHSLLVLCSGDTKSNQVYHLEVRDKSTGALVQNITSEAPRFLVSDLPPSNWLSGLNLTVYTASKETGTINTVETLGVSTSKVAELQHESVVEAGADPSELGASLGVGVGVICGLVITLTCLLSTLAYPAIRHCVLARSASAEDIARGHTNPVTSVASVAGCHTPGHPAYTVYDKVDLLLPTGYSDTSLDTEYTGGGGGTMARGALTTSESETFSIDRGEAPGAGRDSVHNRESIL